jgi:transcription factor IIIB subunit 2
MPVLPEDLIYRFANKMQFGEATHRVAEDACRMVQRMSFDWMVMGRRPAGVCGACLILAARMNNFRRTVHQVVYIVKVTSNTINKRLDEFKETASSKLTVSEFLSNQLLESAHDPPSFYEKNDDFIKNRNAKKRKRKGHDALDLSLSLGIDLTEETGENQRDKRQKSSASSDDVELRRDADGFVIPQQPVPAPTDSVDEVLTTIKEKVPVEFVQELGSQISGLLGEIDDDDDTASTSSKPDRSTKRKQDVHFPSGFGEDKPRVQGLVSEVMFDPNTQAHADAFEKAQARSSELVKILTKGKSPADIPDDHIVGEDEFANDKEVENALFTPAEHEAKKLIWFNENKSWLKKQQAKEHAKAKAANGPPKATRNRKKKPRIGEGQTSAASSPGDAAVEALKKRSWSKKLNYEAIRGLWDPEEAASHPIGSIVGSSNLSRVSSRNGSTVATSATSSNSDDDSDNASSPATSIHKSPSATSSRKATSSKGGARDGDGEEDGEDDDEMGDENDYIDPEENDDDDFHNVVDSVVSHAWKKGLKHTNAEEQENEEDDEDDYANDYGDGDDYQDIGDGGLEDLDLGVWGQDNDDDGDGDEYDD